MVTLKDIAKKVGVSISTVSRVLNYDQTFSVSDKVRIKIYETAEELRYAGKALASHKSLKKKKVAMVMLYDETIELHDSYYIAIRICAKEEARRLGIDVKEYFLHAAEDKNSFSAFSGVLVIGSLEQWHAQEKVRLALLASGLPLVFTDFSPENISQLGDCVINKLDAVMQKVLDHFLSVGIKQIGYVGARDYRIGDQLHHDQRFIAFQEILTAKGLYREDYVYRNNGVTHQSGYQSIQRMIEDNNIPYGIFIENDALAIGAMRALQEHQINVPERLSIISCNDIPAAEFLSTKLSTVALHNELIGSISMRTLIERIQTNRTENLTIIVPHDLVLRDSAI